MAYIPISQRQVIQKTTGYIPVSQRSEKPVVSFESEGLLTDFSFGETQGVSQPFTGGGFGFEDIPSMAKTFARETIRQPASVGVEISSRLDKLLGRPKIEQLAPSDFGKVLGLEQTAKFLFGDDPLPSLEKRIAAGTEIAEKLGFEGAAAKVASGFFILGITGLDFLPFGGSVDDVVKALKVANKAGDIAGSYKILRKIGVAEDIIESGGPRFVKFVDDKSIKAGLESFAKIQQTTKVAKPVAKYTPVAERVSKEAVGTGARLAEGERILKSSAENVQNELTRLRNEMAKGRFADESQRTILQGRINNLEETLQTKFGDAKQFPTIHEGGKVKVVEGTPVEIVEGVETFLHKGDDGWIVSEASTGRFIAESRSADGAVAKAHFVIDDQGGKEQLLKLIEEKKLKTPMPTRATAKTILAEVVEGARELPTPAGLPPIPKSKRPPTPRQLGLAPEPAPKITRREDVLLRGQIRAEARTAKAVKKKDIKALDRFAKAQKRQKAREVKAAVATTRKTVIDKLRTASEASQDIKNDIINFVKQNLDPADRGKALTLVRDAKTPKNLSKAFSRINRWAEEAEKKTIKNVIIKLQKQISDSPSIAIDYKDKIKEVLNDFELKGHRQETIDKLKETRDFLAKEEAKGNNVELPKRVLKALETLNRKPFEQLTINELKGALAEIELLEELGRTKFRTRAEFVALQKESILREIAEQGAESLTTNTLIKPEIGERLTITQKARNLLTNTQNQFSRIDKVISPMDVVFDLLDGGKATYEGANFRFFKARVDAGYGRYITRRDVLQNPVVEVSNKYKLQDTNFERMGVVAAREQDGGVEKLINSGFTQKEIDAVKLTSQEQEVLDLMRKTFDSQFPEIRETMRKVYNEPVEKVKNYFSFMTDWKAADDIEVFRRFGANPTDGEGNILSLGRPTKNVSADFTLSRTGAGKQKIKINALDVFLKHTDNTSYLLELGETTKTLGEIANSPAYLNAVGDAGQLLVNEWVDVIARKGGAAGASEIAALDVLRKNVGVGILGLKLSTIAIQPTSLIDGMGFIGSRYTMRGVKEFSTNTEWRKFIGNMPEIKDRIGGEFALRELTDDNFFQEIQRKGFIPLQKLDQITAGMVANGAYIRKMDELGLAIDLTKPYNEEALAYTQLAVRRTQSSGAFKDIPLAVSRGALTGNRSLDRAILQFQNFLLTRWSRIRHDAIRAGIRTGDPKKAIPIFTAIIMAAIASAGIRLGVNRVIDFITGEEDDKDAEERLLSGFIYEMTGNVPFLGTATSMALYDGEMFPILDAPKGAISGLNRVITSKSPEAKMRGFAEFVGSVGQLGGIPGSAQAEQIIRKSVPEPKTKPKKPKQLQTPPGLPKLPSLDVRLPSLPTF